MGLLELFLVGVLSLSGVVSSGGSGRSTIGQPVIGEVKAMNVLQSGFWYWIMKPTGVEEPTVEVEKPQAFKVWPNPVRGAVSIRSELPVKIYSSDGRFVEEVAGDEWIPKGSGVFFVRSGKEAQKVVVLR
jgi:hypothetical protein